MISNYKIYKKFYIDIIVYKSEHTSKHQCNTMNASRTKYDKNQNSFMCSVCLNQKCANDSKRFECNEIKSRSCPLCQHNCSCSIYENNSSTKNTATSQINNTGKTKSTKNVQTFQPDVSQGLSLLNEVLSVFQNNKQVSKHNDVVPHKTIIYKDIGIGTQDTIALNVKPKLTKSKMFCCSIDDEEYAQDNKFTVISSSQPDRACESRKSLDLIKHKSSSIPQMKLDELKNSLKEKTKSKDAIEEANRMFGTLKRVEEKNNRPMVRSGPRVLPVVKTGKFYEPTDDPKNDSKTDQWFKCGQENNYCMSSGDSSVKHNCKKCAERSEDGVYTLCCQYKQNKQTRDVNCKRCRLIHTETHHH